ncbi:helix-turn-helix domain-containing protein [Paenibacillus sp. J5C_2022]|uniref:helix-turn-helix domain-containing protein n=1 Tax=Paenibacillus sp. J5C2022 TaxID=2977129 RepID=UPI0021D1970F|nr:helix-turn-helix domain-containing protein [Paenibacillus sp. J5C2022]MCU6707938.1 helix-turn-helix domain-containing protein [Paenibacillus sp. J5C2022]
MHGTLSSITVTTAAGQHITVTPVTTCAFHIRSSYSCDLVQAYSPLRQLGAISATEPVQYVTSEHNDWLYLSTADAEVAIDRNSGELLLRSGTGERLARQFPSQLQHEPGESGYYTEFELRADESIYGLGDAPSLPLMKRGCTVPIRMRDHNAHTPVPLLLSATGWGMLADTTEEHEFDIGRSRPDRIRYDRRQEELAYYWMTGSDLNGLLKTYKDLAGPPALLPLWGYGLSFNCNLQTTARDMIEDALKFGREDIPCDLIGLEPTWMEQPEGAGRDRPFRWHPERFYIPQWMPEGEHTFMGALRRIGFKLSLGLYLSQLEDSAPGAYEGSDTGQQRLYSRVAPLVRQGVQGFHLCSKKPYMDSAQSHLPLPQHEAAGEAGLTDTLRIGKELAEGYAAHTGKRPMLSVPAGYAGIQKYGAVSSGGTASPQLAVMNAGLSGIPHMSVDMHLHTSEGIHYAFFQPWVRVNSWAYWRHPALLEKKLLTVFQTYAKLRYRLLPYIYTAAHEAARSGLPIMRAMPLMYPDDAECAALHNQFMFGDSLLVGAFTGRIYLPSGQWFDYWTGQQYDGPGFIDVTVPETAGGPLLVRAGAIIPMWPDVRHTAEGVRTEQLELHLYAGCDGDFELIEDDGESYGYLHGQAVTTAIAFRDEGEQLSLQFGARQGSYPSMPVGRSWRICFHMQGRGAPATVLVDGKTRRKRSGGKAKTKAEDAWHFHRGNGMVELGVNESADRTDARVIELHMKDVARSNSMKKKPEGQARQNEAAADHNRLTMVSEQFNGMNAHNGPGTEEESAPASRHENTIVKETLDLIRQHLDKEELTLQYAADRLHVNSSHLSRRFKQETGSAFSEYLQAARMERARQLLLEGSTVSLAAQDCGFKDASYFIRVFRKHWGVTPGELRK